MSKKDDKQKEKEEQDKLANEVVNLIEEATQKEDKESQKKVTLVLGFLLHPNKYWHMLLSFILNNLVAFPIIGIFRYFSYPLVTAPHFGYIIIALAFFTFGEFVVKMIIMKLMPKVMIYSFGLVFFALYFVIFALIGATMGNYFKFVSVDTWLVFVFTFSVTRLIVSVYYRRLINNIFARIEMKVKK